MSKPPKPRRPGKTIRLPDGLYARLKAKALAAGRPLAWEVRRALEEHVKR